MRTPYYGRFAPTTVYERTKDGELFVMLIFSLEFTHTSNLSIDFIVFTIPRAIIYSPYVDVSWNHNITGEYFEFRTNDIVEPGSIALDDIKTCFTSSKPVFNEHMFTGLIYNS